MPEDQIGYVYDTNVLVDNVDIIPEKGRKCKLVRNLRGKDDIIPSVVVRELSNFKGEKTDRGKAARILLRRIRDIFKDEIATTEDIYNLKASVEIPETGRRLSILPVHKDFRNCLPFHPSDTDMDGQIILTAIAASLALRGININGTELIGRMCTMSFDNVVLVTNDNGLAIRAYERGLKTKRYGCEYPTSYTGRRDIIVTKELFCEFYNSPDGISRKFFEEQMPDEPSLAANEFIVMSLKDIQDYPSSFDYWANPFFDNIGRYDKELGRIVKLRYVNDFPTKAKNPGQAIYAEALMDPNIAAVICAGPAGSGKTYMATVFGYKACLEGRFIGVTVVPCENRSKIGALPGDLNEKMDPDVQPLKNALRNFLLYDDASLKKELEALQKFGVNSKKGYTHNGSKNSSGNSNSSGNDHGNGGGCGLGKRSLKNKLADRVDSIWIDYFSSIPVAVASGRDFAHELAIYDEFQDHNIAQADTLIKRIGRDGKIVLTGDVEQIHAPYLDRDNNGLVYASQQLFDNEMVAQVYFNEDEVVRHLLVKELAKRQKSERTESYK
ncbi:PhoH family protein [Candidatus Saccharibacteria bacterium]|nr:PhoH family protein [Candidatus Saccharibacteria bacterium]